MAKYSLLNVTEQDGGRVSGHWIQDHIGTLESAEELAQETNKVNGGRLDIAVVEQVGTTNPSLRRFGNLPRLN